MTTVDFLKDVIADSSLHARWLNSLSYLEYRGFRKMIRSLPTNCISPDTLTHALEEVRHALFFKKQALRIGGRGFDSYSEEYLLCAEAIKKYFFDLDCRTLKMLKERECANLASSAYALVTWLVEERALSIYAPYQELLAQSDFGFSIAGLLKEEGHHLEKVGLDSLRVLHDQDLSVSLFRTVEGEAFGELWRSLTSAANVEKRGEVLV